MITFIIVSILVALVLLSQIRRVRFKKYEKLEANIFNKWGKQKNEYFNFYLISQYFDKTQNKNSAFQIVGDKQIDDLDFEELFKYVDRTTSKIGQQYLYYKLRTIFDKNRLGNTEKLVKLFSDDSNIRLTCQLSLSRLNSFKAYYFESLINDKQIEKPKYLRYIYYLFFLSLASIVLSFFYKSFLIIVLVIFSVNLFFHYKNKENVTQYVNIVDQLKISIEVAEKMIDIKEIKSHFSNLSFLEKVNNIKSKINFIGFEKSMINSDAGLLFWFIFEVLKVLFNLELIIFYRFIDSVVEEKESIDDLFRFIGEIDSSISIASVKSGNIATCKPQFNNNNQLVVKDIIHPLIKDCVPNSLDLNSKSMLLTGSNMSGKTSFIKSIAVNSLLAQTLNFCFAKEYIAPFFKIYSSINTTDNLLENTSYYLREVAILKQFIGESDMPHNCLFIIDEIFKGTNTIERIAAGSAILDYLNKSQNFIFVSTHDIELTELLEDKNYDLYHFNEKIECNNLYFDYKLKKGKVTTRNAIKILEIKDYPQKITNDVRRILNDLSSL